MCRIKTVHSIQSVYGIVFLWFTVTNEIEVHGVFLWGGDTNYANTHFAEQNKKAASSLASEGLTTATNTNSSKSDSEISDFGSLLARIWGNVTFTPDILFRTLGTFGWHVPCQLLRRDGESSLWYELWRSAHYQLLKPFVISIWGAHYCQQHKFIEIRLWDQRFWNASSMDATPCHVNTRHCI